jgi:hypothetical protein
MYIADAEFPKLRIGQQSEFGMGQAAQFVLRASRFVHMKLICFWRRHSTSRRTSVLWRCSDHLRGVVEWD